MSFFTKKIGIDLGTVNTLVFIPKKGIVLNEPTVITLSSDGKTVLAIGAEAQAMLGRTPENIIVKKPMRDGVIADYHITEAMLRYFIQKKFGPISTDKAGCSRNGAFRFKFNGKTGGY